MGMEKNKCYHCGDEIVGRAIVDHTHSFCCVGCQTVYSILHDNQLGDFYKFESKPGTKPKDLIAGTYDFLELPDIRKKIILFEENNLCKLLLYLPTIHCSSCIYLLENIFKLEPAIAQCFVHFTAREASITFDSSKLKLSELASLLHRIGYPPNFGNRKKTKKILDKQFLLKLGVAGFAFGSIMLWSFPEYLGIDEVNIEFRSFMSYLSLAVSIPVLVYSGNEFLISAWRALRVKSINLDIPISIGILALYLQSAFSILSGQGAGYMDSFASFIFLLLIGKWFQNKTYDSLNFDRDYTSYFPIAVRRKKGNKWEFTTIEELPVGSIIQIRNQEILPCDAILQSDEIAMDYSFVTGESETIIKKKYDTIFAGGKVIGKHAILETIQTVNRSHLTSLWNSSSSKQTKKSTLFPHAVSKWFLIVVLLIAFIACCVWSFIDSSKMLEVVVAVLIVACPCALALSAPFTYGNAMRLLGRRGLYLKDVSVVKDMETISDIVLDKTGTLTQISQQVTFQGDEMADEDVELIFAITQSSTHPYAQALNVFLDKLLVHKNNRIELDKFEEIKGKGIYGRYQNKICLLGSADFLRVTPMDELSSIYVKINREYRGRFIFRSQFRSQIEQTIKKLSNYRLHILSGDSEKDRQMLQNAFPSTTNMLFHQTPQLKKEYIVQLKKQEAKVLMIGDGLNDTGALQEAHVGISISEDVSQFTPSSDAILDAKQFYKLPYLLQIARFSKTILHVCFAFSLIYNIIGLSFALSGQLKPVVAAIIMPLSSITIVLMATFGMRLKDKKL